MSVEQIQAEVSRLPEVERKKLTAWLLAQFPPRSVNELVGRAEEQARRGEWVPLPPAEDNISKGEALAEAIRRAKALGLAQ